MHFPVWQRRPVYNALPSLTTHICLLRTSQFDNADWYPCYALHGNPVDPAIIQIQGPVSWRPTTVKWQCSQSNRHSTIGTRQTEYHEALPSSANVQSHLTPSFADDGNASWYSVCRVPMVEWRLDCENCRHLTVVGLHDTGPWSGSLSLQVSDFRRS